MLDSRTLKDVRKIAFQIGVGFTLGKLFGKGIEAAMRGTINKALKMSAERGYKASQDICDGLRINYEKDTKEDDTKITMGFH